MQEVIKFVNSILKKPIVIIAIIIGLVAVISEVANRREYVTTETAEAMRLLNSMEETGESDDDIDFKAFFLRDTDGDGYTEEMSEIDQALGNSDYMFVELNVKTSGQLKNAKFEIIDSNIKWKTAIISNEIIKNNYIGYTDKIEFNDLSNGTQILLYGKIESKIGSNIHDYDKNSIVRLTGTFVDDEENESIIQKDSNLKVNWYSTTSTAISNNRLTTYNINNAITEEGFKASFSVNVSETTQTYPVNKALMMKEQEATLEIPELNGYKPTSVTVTSSNVEQNYNQETGKLTITRKAVTNEDGTFSKTLSRSNSYAVTVVYPIEAYETLGQDSVMFNVNVTGKSTVFNSEKFGDLESSASTTLSIVYKEIINNPTTPVVREYDTWNLYTTIGTYAKKDTSSAYRISKENVQNLYDGQVYEDIADTYPVVWEVSVGEQEKIEKITLEENSVDKFNNTTEMTNYEKTTGVYFSNASTFLGENGKIELYNAEGGLLETFTKGNWDRYTSSNPYKLNTQSIKVVTTKPIANTHFYVYQIKELDDEKIVEDYDTQEKIDNLRSIYTYAKGSIELGEGKVSNTSVTQTKTASAVFDKPASLVSFSSSPAEIANQKPQDVTLTITTSSSNSFEKEWKDGTFLVELPAEILRADISNIEISDNNVTIKSSLVYKENDKYYVRIDTENEEPAVYTITLKLSVSANPLYSTRTSTIKLYASNKICGNYFTTVNDTYDLDNDGSTADSVAYRTRSIELLAAQGLITESYITEYDDNGSVAIAPNIAEIDRSDEARTAKINISIANNYPETISEMTIIGKVPYEGNTYILNGTNLRSQYTTHMKGAITVPQELQQYTTVYYSEKETPTKDLTDSNNGWTQTVTDWTKIKSYLIDLGEFVLTNTGNKVFSYEVEVPAKTGYNKAAFATHAVYYGLNTEVGTYLTQTQPNKMGLQVVGRYNLELTKNKYGYENITVPGATYKFTTKDANGESIIRTATTDANGKLLINKLYVEREYTLSEISSPSDYQLNNSEVKFNTNIEEENNVQELRINVTEGNFAGTPEVTLDTNNNYLVKAKTEDEAKYTLVIHTQDEEGNTITDVRYAITGKEQGKVYKDVNSAVQVKSLELNEEYQIQLMRAIGYYTDDNPRNFKIVRDETTNKLMVITEDNQLKEVVIVEKNSGQSEVTLINKVEKIPTYNLEIVKIEEPKEGETELIKLAGAQFKLFEDDLQETSYYTTDENGKINKSGLYNYVEGKNITGKYTLQEIKAPEGYSNNAEEITFFVEKTQEGLTVTIENESTLKTVYSTEIEDNIVKLIIKDQPLFKLTKVDSEQVDENGNPILLSNAKFIIYEIDENREVIDYARDVNGNYVGEQNENEEYIVTTDENGEITVPLRAGNYKLVEVGYPNGYYEEENVKLFKIYGNTETEITEVIGEIEINYIEDLVELATNINKGVKYDHAIVNLNRTLDFNEDSSYRNPNTMEYGNINGDAETQSIKAELTTGRGFVPIGKTEERAFRGSFNGKGYKIKNLYVNSYLLYSGLFGYANDSEIRNLEVTGKVTIKCGEWGDQSYTGGIAGYIKNSVITNCSTDVEIIGNHGSYQSSAGGITGGANNSKISNCYNLNSIEANINNGYSNTYPGRAAGITATAASTTISNCYNTGAISAEEAGGICSYVGDGTKIEYCYNKGTISSNTGATKKDYNGIVGGIASSVASAYIDNCYNNGTIKSYGYNSNSSYSTSCIAGGIVGTEAMFGTARINNCYNTGTVISGENTTTTTRAGGIVGYLSKQHNINNCYNIGEINSNGTTGNVGGIAGQINYSTITVNNCYYLEGDYLSGNTNSNIGEIKNETQMKSDDFVTQLGEEHWESDNNTNSGYPILKQKEFNVANNYITGIVEIEYIEDLVELSKNINSEISYKSAEIKLMRTLDFNENDSYKNPNSTEYGDLNGDDEVQDIKTELTTGTGFKPIGTTDRAFESVFDGQGYEIRNLYINNPSEAAGLFGSIKNAKIQNIGIVNSNITGSVAGGLVGRSSDSAYQIINCCYNTGTVNGNVDAGGIIGSLYKNTTINNCYNTGEVTVNTSNDFINAVGGIVGYVSGENVMVRNCYNTGAIKISNIKTSTSGSTSWARTSAGGIAGSTSYALTNSIDNCYNEGEIYCNGTVYRARECNVYVGGIVGDGKVVTNCYNAGKIVGISKSASYQANCYSGGILGTGGTVKNCYNTGSVNGTSSYTRYGSSYSYTGGIVGSWGTITNCYNVGSVNSSASKSYVGGIKGNTSGTVSNSYYLNTIKLVGNTIDDGGDEATAIDMISRDFYNQLNVDKVWHYNVGDYPTLKNMDVIVTEIEETTELEVENTIKKYKISTSVIGSEGGNVIAEDEIVQHGKNSTKPIQIVPNEGYEIIEITINGVPLKYRVEQDGSYVFPTNYFMNVEEDKEIVVTFAASDSIFAIKKVDSDDNTKALSSAKFLITNDSRDENITGIGEIVDNGTYYKEIRDEKIIELESELIENGSEYESADKEKKAENVLSEIRDNGNTYTFVKNEDGTYTSNNQRKAYTANSYFEIDLSEKTGNYVVVVNANISSRESYDYGYATITTDNTSIPTYNTTSGRFIYISGTTAEVTTPTDYASTKLEGGRKYYLYLGYRKAATSYQGTDTFTINSIDVYETCNKRYGFNEENGVYTPNNIGVAGTVANSYIKIDLRNKTQKYFITLDAQASSSISTEYLYATINNNTSAPAYSNTSGRLFYSYSTNTTYQSALLNGGSIYYLHLGYVNSGNGKRGTTQISNVKLYEATRYGFEKVDGKYISNNQNKDSTTANSYIPINLTGKTGKYNLKVNAEISSQLGIDIGYVTVNQSTTAPSYSTTTGRFIYTSGEKNEKEFTQILNGGKLYYLHLGYYKDSSTSSGTDTFKINNIELSLNRDDHVYEEVTTDEDREVKLAVPGNSVLYITELEAPEGYTLDRTTRTYTMVPGQINELTITNKKQTIATVHHYLKGTTNKVAPDEIIKGDIGAEYKTEPKIDLNKMTLEKDVEGKSIVPVNAEGTYGDTDFEVIYYYEVEPIRLTIHHYMDGTEDKYAEDEVILTEPSIEFDGEGNYTITTEFKKEYALNTNSTYQNLPVSKKLVSIQSTTQDDLTIDDTLQYDQDTELTYLYENSKFSYTTEYYYGKNIYNETTGELKEVQYEKDESLTENAELEYGSVVSEYKTEGKQKEGYKFEKVKTLDSNGDEKDLPLTITEDTSKNVIKVYYIPDETKTKTLTYTVEYYKEDTKQESDTQTETKTVQMLEDNTLAVDKTKINTTNKYIGYKLDLEKTADIPDRVENGTIIRIYYTLDETQIKDINYTVEYYKDGVIDNEKTQNETTSVQVLQPNTMAVDTSKINTTDIFGEDYKFDHTEPSTIPETIENNGVIKVYYVLKTRDINYTIEYYKEGTKVINETQVITIKVPEKQESNEVELDTENVKTFPGYKLDKYIVNGEETTTLPATVESGTTISVYYIVDGDSKKTLSYTVEYYKAGVKDEGATQTESITVHTLEPDTIPVDTSKINTTDKYIGYRFSSTSPSTIPQTIANNGVIKVYYVKNSYRYTVNYYYEGELDTSKTYTTTALFENQITSYPARNKTGFTLERVEGLPLTIGVDQTQNLIKVYYTSEKTSYTIKKTWSNLTEAQANNYRATFNLKNKSNNEIVKDSEGNPLSVTIRGNNTATIQNVPKYGINGVAQYTAVEVKVEKTTDGGTTWVEVDLSNVTAQYEEGTRLADVVSVGDYVNYDASSGEARTLVADINVTGSDQTATYDNQDSESQNQRWRVLSVDRESGKVELVADEPMGTKVMSFYSTNGAKKYINGLNAGCEIYGYGKGAVSARSINKADFDQYTSYDYSSYSHSTSGGATYGYSKTYTSGKYYDGLGNEYDAPFTASQTGVKYTAAGYFDNTVYNMLFKQSSDSSQYKRPYYVADLATIVMKNSDVVFYDATVVVNGMYDTWYNDVSYTSTTGQSFKLRLCNSAGGNLSRTQAFIMPVVELQTNIMTLGKNGNNAWILDVEGAEGTSNTVDIVNTKVTNSVVASYKVKSEWNVNNPENYESTFTLYKSVDGATPTVVTDNEGNPVEETFVGNGEVEFINLPVTEDGKEVVYTVQQTKIRKSTDGENWTEENVNNYKTEYRTDDDTVDLVVSNSLANVFSLDILKTDVENNPLSGVVYNISIKDGETELVPDSTKDYTTGEDGKLTEILKDLLITGENKTYTVTIKEKSTKEGYLLNGDIVFEVTSKSTSDGRYYELVANTLTNVDNAKSVVITADGITVNAAGALNKTSYTVKYMEKDTTNEIATALVVNDQLIGTEVSATAIDIDGFDKEEPVSQTITITTGTNEIIFYYTRKANLQYTVNYLEKDTGNVLKTQKVAQSYFGNEITSESEKIDIDYYRFVEADKEKITIGTNEAANVLNLYYTLRDDLSYTVRYLEKGTSTEISQFKKVENQVYGTTISSISEKIDIPGYMYDSVEKDSITIGIDENENIIRIYYLYTWKVTTGVESHTEHYSNGSTRVKNGGSVSGAESEYYELVGNGKDAAKDIVIEPESGYEISKVTINGTELDISTYVAEDGTITLNKDNCTYLKTIASDINVKATFAKKSSVVIKYLEKDTREALADEVVKTGTEGTEFVPERKVIDNYRKAEVELTQNGVATGETASETYEGFYVEGDLTKYTQGNTPIYANRTTIIYWYEKIPEATVVVKRIEVNQEEIDNGLTMSVGTEIESESYTLRPGESVTTIRKAILDEETSRNYIAVDGPVSVTRRSVSGTVDGLDIVILGKDENEYTATMVEKDSNNDGKMDSMEIRYYYARQYKISTSVENGSTEADYEMVTRLGNSTKEIVVTPVSEDYEIKSVQINGREINLATLIDETGAVRIGAGYFREITEDKNITVTYAKIPARVIVRYLEEGTNKEIKESKIILGTVNDDYRVEVLELQHFELVTSKLPTNSEGKMTKDDIEVVYYYKIKDYDYAVEYYYDDKKDEAKTENNKAAYGTVIEVYKDKIVEEYKLEKEENLPLTVTDKIEDNVIKIYYIKEQKETEDKPEEKPEDGEEQEDKPEEEGKDNNEENKEQEKTIVDDEEIPPFPGLPQTDDNIMSSIFTLIGSSLSLMLVTAAGKRGKRSKRSKRSRRNKRHSKK